MFSFDGSTIGRDDTYMRPCSCAEEDDPEPDRSFCYVEGTELDKSRSDNKVEYSENIWFETKPPRLFTKDVHPLVTARQIHVSRIIMSGTRAHCTRSPVQDPPKENIIINMSKKKSAVRFYSKTDLGLD